MNIIFGGPSASAYQERAEELKIASKIVESNVCQTPGCWVGLIKGAKCVDKEGTSSTCLKAAEAHLGAKNERE